MIQLIYGEDVVSAEESLAEITRNTGPDDLRDINYTSFLAEDVTPEQLNAAIFTIPFMSDFRVVVVRGLLTTFERGRRRSGGSKSNRNPLGQWAGLPDELGSIPPTTNLTFVDGALSKSNPMLRKLASLSDAREFTLPRERDMPGWIMARAKTLGVNIEPRASATLAEAIGRQPRLIDTELRKLALYVDGRPIREDDVRRMVAYVREANIFQAVDAVIDGRTGVALSLDYPHNGRRKPRRVHTDHARATGEASAHGERHDHARSAARRHKPQAAPLRMGTQQDAPTGTTHDPGISRLLPPPPHRNRPDPEDQAHPRTTRHRNARSRPHDAMTTVGD